MKQTARWSKAEAELLLAMKKEGKTDAEIGRHFGISSAAAAMKYSHLRGRVRAEVRGQNVTIALDEQGSRAERPWTAAENAELLARRGRMDPFWSIGDDLRRTGTACQVQYNLLKRGARPLVPVPPQAVMKEAAKAAAFIRVQPRSSFLTAADILGDPPPGRSALDQKRGGQHGSP